MSLVLPPFPVGTRVRFPAFEEDGQEYPAETTTYLGDGMYEVDEADRTDLRDDGLRELSWDEWEVTAEILATPDTYHGFNVRITYGAAPQWPFVTPVATYVANVTLVPGSPVPEIPVNPDYPNLVSVEIEAIEAHDAEVVAIA